MMFSSIASNKSLVDMLVCSSWIDADITGGSVAFCCSWFAVPVGQQILKINVNRIHRENSLHLYSV